MSLDVKVTIILPSLNPDEKLMEVVKGLVDYGFERIIVVNDGSDAAYLQPFEEAATYPQCTILKHHKNYGKGRALKTAFNYYLNNNPTGDLGVITIDGDNQHHVDDIYACAKALTETPDHLVLGVRNFNEPHVPPRSRFGNKMTSFVFKSACGLKISDTQTGLRAIPNQWIYQFLDLYGERFEYETNMLLEIKNKHIPMREVGIRTIYLDGNATSHFNPIIDSIKIYRLLFKFVFASTVSSLVDIGAYWLIFRQLVMLPLRGQIFWATVIARIISSVLNYVVNRKIVFASKAGLRKSMLKYYSLCLVQMGVSYLLVFWLTDLLGGGSVLVKILVDAGLFCLSFGIQREWVFRNKKSISA